VPKNPRRTAASLVTLTALLSACASAPPKTNIGWDTNINFSKYHTWAWKPDGSISDPVWARRCQDVLSDQLQTDGLTQVNLDQNPDLWGVMHARFKAETQIVPFGPDWGYAWGGWAPVEDFEQQIPVGTIVIDLVDVKLKRAVWQGKGKDTIDPSKSNEAHEEQLIAVLKDLFAGYPPTTTAAH
jgi:Domain of unknown function (DUF4136)